MNRYIVLSFLIFSSTFTHAMEKESSFLSFFSWFSSNQTPQESKLISDLRRNKDDFERKLLSNQEQVKLAFKKHPLGNFLKSAHYPLWLLQYCYYQEIIKHIDDNLSLIATLPYCKNMQVNGYTALGATIISREPSIDKKRFLIQKLLNSGFGLTPEDISLAELVLYDGIAKYQKTFLHLSHAQPEANWSVLPQEIRTHIAQYMIQLFKKDFWLLPETASDNLLK